ncbi:hypothetical protein ACROYT_G009470 [Oculina patagonica]
MKFNRWTGSAILDLPFIARRPRRTSPTSLAGDVTSKFAGDDWGRGWKTPTPNRQKEDHLNRSQLPARSFREMSTRNSADSYFKQDLSHLLSSKDPVNRLEKPDLARIQPARRSLTISRALGSDDDSGYSKTGRYVGKEFSGSSRTSFEHNFNHNERIKAINSATQPKENFNIVGVTYRSVNEMPYFYDIRGQANRMSDYSSGAKSPLNDRVRLGHSSVSTPLNQSVFRREERHFSAIPAIEAFNRRSRVYKTKKQRAYEGHPVQQLEQASDSV